MREGCETIENIVGDLEAKEMVSKNNFNINLHKLKGS